MLGLVTDRTDRNVSYRASLSAKGWANMTTTERADWMGDPFTTEGANLMACGPYYSSVVELKYQSDSIVAKALVGGSYLYAVSIVGQASNYVDKTFTLSLDRVESVGGGIAQISMYWHDDGGFEYAGANLTGAGSVTFNTAEFPNTNNRAYLAMYVYVTTSVAVTAGASARFYGVMFENGSTRHEYVPYTEILPTLATKGAYNYSDLNRVERAVEEISDVAGLGLTTRTNWAMWDIPTASEMARYLNNVKAVREFCGSDIPLPSTMNNLDYEGANNIEKILLAASELI